MPVLTPIQIGARHLRYDKDDDSTIPRLADWCIGRGKYFSSRDIRGVCERRPNHQDMQVRFPERKDPVSDSMYVDTSCRQFTSAKDWFRFVDSYVCSELQIYNISEEQRDNSTQQQTLHKRNFPEMRNQTPQTP